MKDLQTELFLLEGKDIVVNSVSKNNGYILYLQKCDVSEKQGIITMGNFKTIKCSLQILIPLCLVETFQAYKERLIINYKNKDKMMFIH